MADGQAPSARDALREAILEAERLPEDALARVAEAVRGAVVEERRQAFLALLHVVRSDANPVNGLGHLVREAARGFREGFAFGHERDPQRAGE